MGLGPTRLSLCMYIYARKLPVAPPRIKNLYNKATNFNKLVNFINTMAIFMESRRVPAADAPQTGPSQYSENVLKSPESDIYNMFSHFLNTFETNITFLIF